MTPLGRDVVPDVYIITARSSGVGMRASPFSKTVCDITLSPFVRMTMFMRSTVVFDSLAKSLSETSMALASEWAIIMSSSSPVNTQSTG